MKSSGVLGVVLGLFIQAHGAFALLDDGRTILEYIFPYFHPSFIEAIVTGVLFFVLSAGIAWHMIRHRSWWCWCLLVGSFGTGLGLIMRGVFSKVAQDSVAVYATSEALIVCMPAFFLAFNYMLYHRLIVHNIGAKYTWFKPLWLSRIFVGIDLTTFNLQSAASGLLNSDTPSTVTTGQMLLKIGIVAQAVSYFVFVAMTIWTHVKLRQARVTTGREVWWLGLWMLHHSSACLIIRSVYRSVQAVSPADANINQLEGWLYGLDIIPLLSSTALYLFRWPSGMLGVDPVKSSSDLNVIPLEDRLRRETSGVSSGHRSVESSLATA